MDVAVAMPLRNCLFPDAKDGRIAESFGQRVGMYREPDVKVASVSLLIEKRLIYERGQVLAKDRETKKVALPVDRKIKMAKVNWQRFSDSSRAIVAGMSGDRTRRQNQLRESKERDSQRLEFLDRIK